MSFECKRKNCRNTASYIAKIDGRSDCKVCKKCKKDEDDNKYWRGNASYIITGWDKL